MSYAHTMRPHSVIFTLCGPHILITLDAHDKNRGLVG